MSRSSRSKGRGTDSISEGEGLGARLHVALQNKPSGKEVVMGRFVVMGVVMGVFKV
jgi:hypothetical protein